MQMVPTQSTTPIVVNNVGGATGNYSLKDTPQFDNDVTINSGSYGGQKWIDEHKRQYNIGNKYSDSRRNAIHTI